LGVKGMVLLTPYSKLIKRKILMIITPKVRGFICTTAHPAGCEENVRRQINYVKQHAKVNGAKKVLVIGASTGYGLASRISSAFGCGAATIGIIYEKEASGSRTASAGWYNTAAFEKIAESEGLYAKTINGDAFSKDIKTKTIELIKKDIGKIDLLVYSIASPRRTNHEGETFSSVIKPIGNKYENKTIDLTTKMVSTVAVEPATEQEIASTIKVMGGEDWQLWIDALSKADVLAEGFNTIAYSYIGPEVTHPIYLNGTIGLAKRDLKATAENIAKQLTGINAHGYISVNKALVTQASAAIPVVPLYISILYKIMKQKGIHEGCIEQIYRLYKDKLYAASPVLDSEGMLRIDDWEMRGDIQQEADKIWAIIDNDNVTQVADINGYWNDFYNLFGFGFDNVDYEADVDIDVKVESICE
jgi:enoyl-[acyl-carrier protein] reductase/trans-2-enoyl-CoA reductase (NAD+)